MSPDRRDGRLRMRERVAPPRTPGAGPADGPLPRTPEVVGGARPVPWWVHGLAGLAGIVLGAVVLAYPDPSVKLLGVLVGIDLSLVGIALIVRAVAGDDGDAGPGGLLLGALALIAGIAAIRNPGASITLIVLALGAFLIVAGAFALAHGLLQGRHRWLSLLRGVVFIAMGTVIIAWPHVSVATLAVLSGIVLIIQGVVEVAGAWVLRGVPEPALL
jgi:uncharacterized membrane protein HdeD (DUF308 family)